MLQRARDSLDKYEKIADIAQEALDSFLGNNSRPLKDPLEVANFDRNKTMLERDLAKALRDVAKAQLQLLAKNAQGPQLAKAET
jgi:hypothetical protein